MSTIVQSLPQAALDGRSDPCVMRRYVTRILEARWQSAERKVLAYLQDQSDARLARLGFSAADIVRLRAGASLSSPSNPQ
jgi:hypothetical protein